MNAHAWGTEVSFLATNLNAQVGRTIGSISLSTSNMTYSNANGLNASGGGKTFTLTANGGATISQILITSTTGSRYKAANITNCTSCTREGNVYTCTISPAASEVACKNSDGGLNITRIDVTYSGGTSTKRIYMKCGSTWCSSSPKFFAHSWGGTAENDLELTAVGGCETDVYYVDIPSDNTSVIFTRQNSSSTGIAWSPDGNFWNQSEDISISTNDLFTCTSLSSKGTFSEGTYEAPTHTVTYNANGGSGSVPTDATAYEYGETVTVQGKNTLTKTNYVFAGWNTQNAGSGTWYAPGETFNMACSNVTLYAQWATCIDTKDLAALSDATATRNLENTRTSLTNNNIKHSIAGDTKYDTSSGYHGLKLRNSGDWIGFAVAAGKKVIVTTETVNTSPVVTIDFSPTTTLSANTGNEYAADNSNARFFRIKAANGNAVVINKIEITTACTLPELAYGTATVTKVYGDDDFTNPLTNSHGVTVTYTSSNTDVATVNSSTGAVTIKAAGTTTITASSSQQTVSEVKYCADEASYTLNVGPAVTVGPTDVEGNYGYRYTIGQTIDLTATPSGGSSYTYQWQKYKNSAWADIANGEDATDGGTFSGVTTAHLQISGCTASNAGSYRCNVTAAGQTNADAGYRVRIYTFNGKYYGGGATGYAITWTGEHTGTVTLNLTAKSVYQFKVTDNDGKWYGSGKDNYIIQPVSMDCGTTEGNVDVRLLTAPAGDYTFTIDITHAEDGASAFVNVRTAYPSVTHPNDGYVYLTKDAWRPYLHYWYDAKTILTDASADPQLGEDQYTTICGNDYWCIPVINQYCNFIARDNPTSPTNTTGDQHTNSDHPGQNIYHDGTWKWRSLTRTISFNSNYGSGTTASITHICPGTDATAPDNGFTRAGWTFVGWCSNKYGKGKKIYQPGDEISAITSDSTLYAQWERTIYFYSTASGWYEYDAKTQLHYWDGSDDSKEGYITMTQANTCFTPTIYKATITGGGYNKLQFKRLKSDESESWTETVDLNFNDTYSVYKLTNMSGGEGDKAYGVFDSNYSAPTFTIRYAGGEDAEEGSRDDETKTCDVDFTLPSSAVFTRTGYTQTGWALTENGPQSHSLGGNYTTNAAQTFYPVWSQIMVSSITLDPTSKTLVIDGTQTIDATVSPSTALDKAITWTTSDDDVATVDGGVVTAVGAGTATITATAHDGSGVYATCAITVNKKDPTTYNFSADNTSICSGDDVTFTIDGSQLGLAYYITQNPSGGSAIGDSQDGDGSALDFTVSGASSGDYYCYTTGTDEYKAAKISKSKVTISYKTATSITTEPTSVLDAVVGEEATLTVVAAGTSLNYQWKESATEDGTYTNVASGGTSATYAVTPAAAGTKWYKCVVTGDCGSATTEARKIVAAAAVDPLVTWTMNTTDDAAWETTSTSNHGNTEISTIGTSHDEGSNKAKNSATAKTAMASGEVTTSDAPNKSARYTFTLASGYKIEPTKITCQVFNVSDGSRTYKAQIKDDNSNVYNSTNTVAVSEEATLTDATFNFAADLELKGNVTLMVYAWDTDASKDPTEFRMGQYIKFYGDIVSDGYAITKSATNGTISTKVSGSEVTSAAEDATVTITATPSTGYHFTGWTVTETESEDPVTVAASWRTPTTFTMPAAAVTVDAGFELTNHRITLSSAFKGEYTVQVDGGVATRFSTTATYGQTITLHTTRTSTNEYVWSTWGVTMTETGDPVAVTLSTDSTFAMPDGPVTIRPIYGKLYTVSFNTNGGSSAPGDIKQTTVGGTITMPSAPTKSGCTFAGWVIGSETYAAGSTSYVPTDDVTAIAAWKATCAGGGGSDTNITIFDGTISTNPAPNATDGTSGLTYKKGKEYTDATTGFKHKLVDIKDALVDISEVSFTNKGSYVNAIKWGGSSTQYFAQFVVPSGYTASVTLTYVLTSGATKYIGFGTSNSAMPNGSNFDTNVAISTNNAVGSYTFSSLSSGTYYLMCSGGDKFYILGLSATVTSSGTCNYVTYNGNGATGGITNDPTAYDNDAAVTVLANGFSRPGYEFTGWNTEDDGTGTAYDPDDDDHNTFTISGNTTLYAQWNPLTLYFNGAGSGTDYDWFNKVNWTVSGGEPGCVPTIEHDVVLEKQTRLYGQEVSGEGNHAKAKSIKIDKSTDARKNIRMEIWSYCSMIVAQGITAKHIGDADFGATTYEDVRVETSILGNAGLVCGNASSNTEVTYIFRTKAFMVTVEGKKYYRNQYLGIPFTTIDGDQYWGSILYKYDDNNDVWMAAPTDGEGKITLAPFTAYNLIRKVESGDEFTLKGILNLPGTGGSKTRTLTCGWRAADTESTIDANKAYQDFMFANSWSAPIDISSMTASDCSGESGADLVHTIYIFNTGYEVGGVKQVGDEDGQWSAFPFESSAYMEGAVIPATQAFLVTSKKGSTGATLTLDYKKHVYDPAVAAGQTNTFATRAPRRNRAEYDAPIILKMTVKTDSLVLDKLYMFERPDFTNEFDNGWDGTKIEGVTTVPMIYAVQGNSKMAVSAVPELDGEEIVFRAGTKTDVYTFEFEYDEDAYPLYLYDRDTEEFTLIENKSTYTFMTEDTDEHARFVLTRSKSPQIATGFIDGVETSNKEIDTTVRKIIKNDHVYILRGGHVYSIDGSMIK